VCRRWRTDPGGFGSKLWLWSCRPDPGRWSFEECVDVVLLILCRFSGNEIRDWIRCLVSRRRWSGARELSWSWSVGVFEDGLDAAELGAGGAGVMVV
jgi:hypothetical protein